jgi:hypothetical protein
MKVPTSEAMSATRRLRKVAARKGRQRLGVCLGFGLTVLNSFLSQQNKAGVQQIDCSNFGLKQVFILAQRRG